MKVASTSRSTRGRLAPAPSRSATTAGRSASCSATASPGRRPRMRPWAEHLASAGLSVRLPLLPGHGTEWQQMQITRWPDWYGCRGARAARPRRPVRRGLRHGAVDGRHPHPAPRARAAGCWSRASRSSTPSVHSKNPALRALPVLRHVLPTVPRHPQRHQEARAGRAGLRAGAAAGAPLADRAVGTTSLRGWPEISCPMIAFGSDDDHVVEPSNSVEIVQGVSSRDVTFIPLHDSYHVATLDNDAPLIFEQSLAFVQRLTATHERHGVGRHGAAVVTTSPDDAGEPDETHAIDAAFDEIVANIDRPGHRRLHRTVARGRGHRLPIRAPPPAAPTPQRTPRTEWSEWDDIRLPQAEPEDELERDPRTKATTCRRHLRPLPKGDKVGRWAWAGAIGAPTAGDRAAAAGLGTRRAHRDRARRRVPGRVRHPDLAAAARPAGRRRPRRRRRRLAAVSNASRAGHASGCLGRLSPRATPTRSAAPEAAAGPTSPPVAAVVSSRASHAICRLPGKIRTNSAAAASAAGRRVLLGISATPTTISATPEP